MFPLFWVKTQILHCWLKIIMDVKEIAFTSILKTRLIVAAGLLVSTWRIQSLSLLRFFGLVQLYFIM
jgi:hypothetical protein